MLTKISTLPEECLSFLNLFLQLPKPISGLGNCYSCEKRPKNAQIHVIGLDTEEFFGMSSYDQNFFRCEKYEVRAFQRIISRPSGTPRSVCMLLYVSEYFFLYLQDPVFIFVYLY